MTGHEALNRASTFLAAASREAERMGRTLWRILSMSPADDAFWPQGCLCAVLADEGLHVLHAGRALGRLRIHGRRFYSLREGSSHAPQALAADLQLAMTDLKAGGADVILVVPGSWVISRRAEMPSTVGGHLSRVVGYELDRLTPLAADAAWYDYGLIGQQPQSVRIAVAAARADRIDPYLDALRERGVQVRRVVSAIGALGSLCRYVYRADTCLFVEPSAEGYEGGLLENGVVSLSFSGRFASKDPGERARQLSQAMREVLDRHLPDGDPPWVITGRTAWESAQALVERMGRPVKVLQPADIRERIPEATEGLSLAALGGVLATIVPEARGMNLLDRGEHAERKPPRALTAVLAAALAAAGLFILFSPLQVEERRIEEIDRQIEARKGEVRKAEAVKREVDGLEAEIAAIARFKTERPVALEILRELTAIVPKSTWLSRARITDTAVDLEGYSATATDILPLLEASPYFKKAEFASPTLRDARLNADRFTIRTELEGLKRNGLEPDKKQ